MILKFRKSSKKYLSIGINRDDSNKIVAIIIPSIHKVNWKSRNQYELLLLCFYIDIIIEK